MMWPPFSRRAVQFAARLDGHPVTGSLDDDTAALVSLAERLRHVERPALRPDYAAALRLRLLDVAPGLLVAGAAVPDPGRPRAGANRRRSTRQVRLGVATATAIVLATGVGIGYASQSALPGDPLYPFKQTIEHVQVATAGSLTDKGNAQLTQASTRLTEVQDLASHHPHDPSATILMKSTMGDFSHEANDGTVTLLTAYYHDHEPQAIVDLRDFTNKSVDSLNQLSSSVPESVLPDVGAAASLMSWVDANAKTVCSACAPAPALTLPPALAAIAPDVPPVTPGSLVPGNGDPAISPLPGASSSAPPASESSSVVSVPPSSVPPVTAPPPTEGPPGSSAPPSSDPGSSSTPPSPPVVVVTVTPPPVTPTLPTTQTPTPPTTTDPPSGGSSSDDPVGPPTSTEQSQPILPTDPTGLTSAPTTDLTATVPKR